MANEMTRRGLLQGGLALLGGGVAGAAPTGSNVPRRLLKAVYLSYYGVCDRTIRGRVLDLLDRTELNAVVIDVKGDRGFIPYESRIPLARDAGAMGPVRHADVDGLLAELKSKGIHTVARVVAFKDDVLARHRPEWAVEDATTGARWVDNERLAWIDPFREEAWAYPIAVAEEAALKGFDEIQFDYLRFPSDGRVGAARYSQDSTPASRVQAITRFLRQARAALARSGAALAVDIFGYTAFDSDDAGIGQRVEALAPLVDVLCPMAYPSAYHAGIPGIPNPVANPYEVVLETVRRGRGRSAQSPVQIRPWIQDFRDYAFDRRAFGVPEIRAQMKAALDAGATGWMLWNPANRYTADALDPRAPAPRRPAARYAPSSPRTRT
jgi:hypothetical protein